MVEAWRVAAKLPCCLKTLFEFLFQGVAPLRHSSFVYASVAAKSGVQIQDSAGIHTGFDLAGMNTGKTASYELGNEYTAIAVGVDKHLFHPHVFEAAQFCVPAR